MINDWGFLMINNLTTHLVQEKSEFMGYYNQHKLVLPG